MKFLEGKSKEEKVKIIVAIVVGTLAVLALANLIFSPFSGSKKSVTVKLSPTPTASVAANRNGDTVVAPLPKQNEIDAVYTSIPVSVQYPPSAPDAGRNIFAFYEPPIPTPFSPTPYVEKTPKPTPPVVVPQADILLSGISRQSAVAGEKGFRLDVSGDKFRPDTPIWFGGTPLPTNFVSPQQMWADVPANYIAVGGQKMIEVKTADNKSFSNPVYFNVQQPPPPQFTYLGIVSRKRGNNDTAYIQEQGKTLPSSVRLNDIIGGRFRLISIQPAKLLVQDVNYNFIPPYPIELAKGSGQSSSTRTTNPNYPNYPNDPSVVNPNIPPQQCPPGIPCTNLRPYVIQTPQPQKKDVDDDNPDEDGDN